MADRNIDLAKANSWIKDVKAEIKSAEKVLDDIVRETRDMPNSDDTIVQMIEATGGFLDTAWKKTAKGFENAWNAVENAIKDIAKTGEVIARELEEYGNKVKNR